MNMTSKEQGEKIRQNILNYIIEYMTEYGYSPSVREIGEAVGLKSTSSVHTHLTRMFKEGTIETDTGIGTPRAIRVPGYEFKKVEVE